MTAALEAARASGLLEADGPVVVLLSGGRDSVCLLDVAVTLRGASAVRALHVDYGLRAEAAADARACAELCAALGVSLDVHQARRGAGVAGNLQAWARDVRYAEGRRLADAVDGVLAAGHTATDQAETILYRLASSPGRRALLGMPERAGRLVRPLLGVTRADTAAHCTARGLRWVDDATNDGGAYARSRVRHGLLPALEAVDPRAAANVLRTAELLRDEAVVLDELVDTVLAGDDGIGVTHLAALPRGLARLIVRRLAEAAVGGPCGRVPARLDDVLALGDDGALDLGDGARAVLRAGRLSFTRTPAVRA